MENNRTLIFKSYWEKLGTLIIFLGMFFVIAIFAPPAFMTGENILQIATQSSTFILLGCGEFFAILIAGIDLSVGSIAAVSGMVTAQLMVTGGFAPLPAFLIGSLGCGAVLGLLNGSLVNVTKVHPFIITLGTQAIFRAVTLIISNASPVFGFPASFSTAFGGTINSIPMPVVVALVVAAVLWFVTSRTTFGRNLYVIGGNKDSAWYSGIHVSRHTLAVFVISGICCAIGGAVMTARLGAAEPLAAQGAETQAIAAAIIGGTSFFGGKGKIPNVVVGGLIIGLINNGLNMCGVQTYYQQLATGLLTIAAVALDQAIARKR